MEMIEIDASLAERLNKIRKSVICSSAAPMLMLVDDVAPSDKTQEVIGNRNRTLNWPSNVVAMPTELTRTALFSIISDQNAKGRNVIDDNKENNLLNNIQLASRSDIKIFYTGEQLCVKDETVWLACLRLGRGVPLGEKIFLNMADLLYELKMSDSGENRGVLMARLLRLSKAHFTITLKRKNKKYVVTTGLIKWTTEQDTGKMFFRLDPDSSQLFENLAYQPWSERLKFKNDVAVWLLSYVTGHAQGKCHWVEIEKIKKWCGYSGRLRDFKKVCWVAMQDFEGKGLIEKDSCKIERSGGEEIISWQRTTH